MKETGFNILVSNAGAIVNKKIKLQSERFPDLRLFFSDESFCPSSQIIDLCVTPFKNIENYKYADIPIITFGKVEDMSKAIVFGCVDYLCEPWTIEELFLRIRIAVAGSLFVEVAENGTYIFLKGRRLYCKVPSSEIYFSQKLSITEMNIFNLLIVNRGRFFSREQLAFVLEKTNEINQSRAIDMSISRLKSKIDLLCSTITKDYYNPIITKSRKGWGII